MESFLIYLPYFVGADGTLWELEEDDWGNIRSRMIFGRHLDWNILHITQDVDLAGACLLCKRTHNSKYISYLIPENQDPGRLEQQPTLWEGDPFAAIVTRQIKSLCSFQSGKGFALLCDDGSVWINSEYNPFQPIRLDLLAGGLVADICTMVTTMKDFLFLICNDNTLYFRKCFPYSETSENQDQMLVPPFRLVRTQHRRSPILKVRSTANCLLILLYEDGSVFYNTAQGIDTTQCKPIIPLPMPDSADVSAKIVDFDMGKDRMICVTADGQLWWSCSGKYKKQARWFSVSTKTQRPVPPMVACWAGSGLFSSKCIDITGRLWRFSYEYNPDSKRVRCKIPLTLIPDIPLVKQILNRSKKMPLRPPGIPIPQPVLPPHLQQPQMGAAAMPGHPSSSASSVGSNPYVSVRSYPPPPQVPSQDAAGYRPLPPPQFLIDTRSGSQARPSVDVSAQQRATLPRPHDEIVPPPPPPSHSALDNLTGSKRCRPEEVEGLKQPSSHRPKRYK